MTECPICGANVKYSNVEIGELLNCPDCGSDLEIKSINPLTIAEAPEEEEDWGE